MVRARDGAPPDITPPLSPAVARRRLGIELRLLREAAGLTLVRAGTALQRSQATLSRIENGTTSVRDVDVVRLLDIYRESGVVDIDDALRERLLGLLASGRRKEWFSRFSDVTAGDLTGDYTERFVSFETYAESMSNFEPDLIPGLLQTPGYARAITDACLPEAGERERERLVELRVERRQTIRTQGSPRLNLVIGEVALHRSFGGPKVHAEQLEAIAEEVVNGTPSFTVRIVPSTLALPAAIGGPFVVMTFADPADPAVVFREGPTSGNFDFDPRSVAHCQQQFTTLVENAYSDHEAVERIEEVRAQSV